MIKLEALINFPGDVDLLAPDAEPRPGALVLRGEKLVGSEVWADGHRIGTALAVDRQEYDLVYGDSAEPKDVIMHRTTIVMVLEVPLPRETS